MSGRIIVHTANAEFGPYDLDGLLQPEMAVLLLSYDRDTGEGSYMIRMLPGAETIVHTHARCEEYIILEGSLIESDGTVLNSGDHVTYAKGTRHNSRTDEGCLLLAIDWQRTA